MFSGQRQHQSCLRITLAADFNVGNFDQLFFVFEPDN
jgi:hypothetical protein